MTGGTCREGPLLGVGIAFVPPDGEDCAAALIVRARAAMSRGQVNPFGRIHDIALKCPFPEVRCDTRGSPDIDHALMCGLYI